MPSGVYPHKPCTQETKDKIGRGNRDRKHSPEHVAKRARACMLTWQRKQRERRLEDQKKAKTYLQTRS